MSGTMQVRIGCLDAIGAPLGLLRQHRPRRLLFGLSGGTILALTVGGGAAAERVAAGSCAAPAATIVANAGQARVFKIEDPDTGAIAFTPIMSTMVPRRRKGLGWPNVCGQGKVEGPSTPR